MINMVEKISNRRKIMYEGIAGGIDQNAGQSQSKIWGDGTRATIGLGGVERALNEGYTIPQIQNWINQTGAAVGEKIKIQYGFVDSVAT
jgi:hypothetical protein